MPEVPKPLHLRWKPGTLDTLLLSAGDHTEEWSLARVQAVYGKTVIAQLYLTGRADLPAPPPLHNAAD